MDRTSFYEWKRRFQTHGLEGLPPVHKDHPQTTPEETVQRVLALSEQHTTRGCNFIADHLALEGISHSAVTVQNILTMHGLGGRYERLLALERRAVQEGLELTPAQAEMIERANPCFAERHVESSRPGELLSQDTFYVGQLKGVGKVYLHSLVDTFGSYAFGFLHTSKQPEAAVVLLHNDVLPFYAEREIPVTKVRTDNGASSAPRLSAGQRTRSRRTRSSCTSRSTTSATSGRRSEAPGPTGSWSGGTARSWTSSSGSWPCRTGGSDALHPPNKKLLDKKIKNTIDQAVEAIVNAANTKMRGGGGVDGAIHRAAGKGLMAELERVVPHGAKTGTAVITGGHNLKQKHVIHTPGPFWGGGGKGEATQLASSYRSCLVLADANHLTSLAFCSISTGVYRFPLDQAAPIAVQTTTDYLKAHPDTSLMRIVFAMYQADEYEVFTAALAAME